MGAVTEGREEPETRKWSVLSEGEARPPESEWVGKSQPCFAGQRMVQGGVFSAGGAKYRHVAQQDGSVCRHGAGARGRSLER